MPTLIDRFARFKSLSDLTILKTYRVADPNDASLRFSIMLAGDKGVANQQMNVENGVAVFDVEGSAIVFLAE